jgi:hypothetical protein
VDTDGADRMSAPVRLRARLVRAVKVRFRPTLSGL